MDPSNANLAHARQIGLACKLYAHENGGNFPPTLEALVPDFIPEEEWKKMGLVKFNKSKKTAPWIYFNGLTEASPGDLPLIASAPVKNGLRVVVRVDMRTGYERDR